MSLLDRLTYRWRSLLPARISAELPHFVRRNHHRIWPMLAGLPSELEGGLVTRYVGECGVCEATQKLTQAKRLVHHAYERPGYGYIVGGCMGVGEEPFEVSCDVTKRYLAIVEEKLALWQKRAADLASGKISELPVSNNSEDDAKDVEMIDAKDDRWHWVLELAVIDANRRIRRLQKEIERVNKMLARWVRKPLRTVEEVASARKAERDAQASVRAQEKEQRVRNAIAGYQRRLDTAVKNGTASTIAEIFDGGARKLGDLLGVSSTSARPRLERDHIFRAFGLDPTRSASDPHNEPLLTRMRYNWDNDLVWPAELGSGKRQKRRR